MSITEHIRHLTETAGRPIENWQVQQLVRLYIQRLIAPTGYLPGAPVGPNEFPRDPVPFRHPIQQHRYNVWLKAAFPASEFDERMSMEALDLEDDVKARVVDDCDFIREHTEPPPAWPIPDDPFPGRGWFSDASERGATSPIPKPSTTPPFWAADVSRSRRPKRKGGQPTRQGIA